MDIEEQNDSLRIENTGDKEKVSKETLVTKKKKKKRKKRKSKKKKSSIEDALIKALVHNKAKTKNHSQESNGIKNDPPKNKNKSLYSLFPRLPSTKDAIFGSTNDKEVIPSNFLCLCCLKMVKRPIKKPHRSHPRSKDEVIPSKFLRDYELKNNNNTLVSLPRYEPLGSMQTTLNTKGTAAKKQATKRFYMQLGNIITLQESKNKETEENNSSNCEEQEELENPLKEVFIPPVVQKLHPSLSYQSYSSCRDEESFTSEVVEVCEQCANEIAFIFKNTNNKNGDDINKNNVENTVKADRENQISDIVNKFYSTEIPYAQRLKMFPERYAFEEKGASTFEAQIGSDLGYLSQVPEKFNIGVTNDNWKLWLRADDDILKSKKTEKLKNRIRRIPAINKNKSAHVSSAPILPQVSQKLKQVPNSKKSLTKKYELYGNSPDTAIPDFGTYGLGHADLTTLELRALEKKSQRLEKIIKKREKERIKFEIKRSKMLAEPNQNRNSDKIVLMNAQNRPSSAPSPDSPSEIRNDISNDLSSPYQKIISSNDKKKMFKTSKTKKINKSSKKGKGKSLEEKVKAEQEKQIEKHICDPTKSENVAEKSNEGNYENVEEMRYEYKKELKKASKVYKQSRIFKKKKNEKISEKKDPSKDRDLLNLKFYEKIRELAKKDKEETKYVNSRPQSS